MRPFLQLKNSLIILTAFAVLMGGVARASMPVTHGQGAMEQMIIEAQDTVVLEVLLASAYCTMTEEDSFDPSGPHCALCIAALGPPHEVRDPVYAARAPPAHKPLPSALFIPAARLVTVNGLRAPPLAA
ncbi:MAG: hypothetical protein AAGA69_03470 [Pseudomonadota bacterium]